MTNLCKDITEHLAEFYTSEDTAINGRELSQIFNITNRQLRSIVTILRQEGEPICSSTNGYWYSKDPEDIEKTIHRLEAQVHNMNYSIKGLKSVLQEVNNEAE